MTLKSYWNWSNTQRVSAPTITILPTIRNICARNYHASKYCELFDWTENIHLLNIVAKKHRNQMWVLTCQNIKCWLVSRHNVSDRLIIRTFCLAFFFFFSVVVFLTEFSHYQPDINAAIWCKIKRLWSGFLWIYQFSYHKIDFWSRSTESLKLDNIKN